MSLFTNPSYRVILNQYEGECPLCHSKTILIDGESGYYLGCSMYKVTGCNGKTKLSDEDIKEIDEWNDMILKDEEMAQIYFEAQCGLMCSYPDWDPDEMDINTYKEGHGLD